MSKGLVVVVAEGNAVLLASSVYPSPTWLIDRPEKVATPSSAVAVSVPPSVPLPGFVPDRQRDGAVEERVHLAVGILGGDGQAEAGADRHQRGRLGRHHQLIGDPADIVQARPVQRGESTSAGPRSATRPSSARRRRIGGRRPSHCHWRSGAPGRHERPRHGPP